MYIYTYTREIIKRNSASLCAESRRAMMTKASTLGEWYTFLIKREFARYIPRVFALLYNIHRARGRERKRESAVFSQKKKTKSTRRVWITIKNSWLLRTSRVRWLSLSRAKSRKSARCALHDDEWNKREMKTAPGNTRVREEDKVSQLRESDRCRTTVLAAGSTIQRLCPLFIQRMVYHCW